MPIQHKWSIHRYLSDGHEGLLSKLELSNSQISFLKGLRKQARTQIRNVFSEAQDIFRDAKKLSPDEHTQIYLRQQIKAKRSFDHVSDDMLAALVKLASNLDDEQRRAFLKIRPKFWTQGSFQYKTLNVPYRKPPQEMDIDDGVYFPMQMFEDAPALAHKLMIALVDTALQSLAAENDGWVFDNTKPTCARIHIADQNVHLDVPMYAIPEEKFVLMKESLDARGSNESFADSNEFWLSDETRLDPNSVHLARRDSEKWQKSDPQVVQKWFTESVNDVGEHLRLSCRFLKGWRDVTWENGGGPSSIALMKCAVDTLGQSPLDGKDLGLAINAVASNLAKQFNAGVESPDPSDERPLFPDSSQHNEKQRNMVEAALKLELFLHAAMTAQTREDASRYLSHVFGERGISTTLLNSTFAAPVYATPADKSIPAEIEKTMTSG
ncbi:CBASS cGAMP synthase [Enterovibrio sp. FF113]|uniref:CBASS cGAMP synthase n=1 Tax=Enterovibrio sp. FF113 TaxID=3230010 RepID=UPI00352D76A5